MLAITLLLAWWAYEPGLSGGFLFDDFGNLPSLGANGPVETWAVFWRYITSGIADPTGRPLTLLTFLLDATNWPADPFPFKRTNLILHLINGVLLYALSTKLGELLKLDGHRRRAAALVASALWLLHPLLVSTTLYIVQREAMLPATFVIVGLLAWLHGRSKLAAGQIGTGVCWSVFGLAGFSLLGVLAKANGALLPLYALLIEIIVVAPRHPLLQERTRRLHRVIMFTLAVVPTVALVAYLVRVGVNGVIHGGVAGNRSWTYAQRLMTEPRILLDYLQLLWIPRPFSTGLFNDQYVASTSWWHPISTLPALLVVVGLIGGAWHLRRRHPALALAVLFYFSGHLIESTSIALELYFEHRNYVPALFMFWPLGLWLADIRSLRLMKRALMLLLPLVLASLTHTRAQVWGNVQTQALIWAHINPESPRAQANAAQIEMHHGHPKRAISRLESLLDSHPDQLQIVFNLIGARCMTGGLRSGDMAAARRAMQSTVNNGTLFAHWFERTLPVAMSGSCPGLTPTDLLSLIDVGLKNPKLSAAGAQQDLLYMRGRIVLAQHKPDAATADFAQALDLQVRPGMALEAAATLGNAGYPAQGLHLLDHYQQVKGRTMQPRSGMPTLHEWVLAQQNYWPGEIARLRQQLVIDAKTNYTDTASSNAHRSTNN